MKNTAKKIGLGLLAIIVILPGYHFIAEALSHPVTRYGYVDDSGGMRPYLIAHRLGSGLGPENTCAAALNSSVYQPEFYELDVYFTSDNQCVVIHDDTLDETTNLSGPVNDITWEELSLAEAGSWFDGAFAGEKIPLLIDVLTCVNGTPLAIEIKQKNITKDQCEIISEILKSVNDTESIIFSFNQNALENYREVDSNRATGYVSYLFNSYAVNGDHEVVTLLGQLCFKRTVVKLHNASKAVFIFGVNSGFERYVDMGVDGIITDYPDRLRNYFEGN